jgi:hypothetical protein
MAASMRRSNSFSARSPERRVMPGRTSDLWNCYKARGNTAAAKQAEADLVRTWIGDRRLLQISNL